jgi:hypothetical protein
MDITQIKPFVVEDFLTADEYASIYKTINDAIEENVAAGNDPYDEPFKKLVTNGFIVYFENFEQKVLDKFKSGLEAAVGHPVKKPGVLFCRYSKKSGDFPRLLPHSDRIMKNPSVTTTLELDTTIDWDIYVEDEKFNLTKNEMLIFSGSHNVHWRPYIEFGDEDYFDIIILQSSLEKEDDVVLDDEFFNMRDHESGKFIHKYMPLLEKALGDRRGRE